MKTYNVRPFPGYREMVKGTLMRFAAGSMTVETSIVLPLFLLFFINLSSSIEMIRLHGNIETALWSAGSNVSFYGALVTKPVLEMKGTGFLSLPDNKGSDTGAYEEDFAISGDDSETDTRLGDMKISDIQGEIGDLAVSYLYVGEKIKDYLGEAYLDSSPIKGGKNGLCLIESEIVGEGDIVDIGVSYEVSPPFDFGNTLSFRMANRYYAHLWNGYDVNRGEEETDSGELVYITENSKVYHSTPECTYLKLSVRETSRDALADERNKSGGRYGKCLVCARGDPPETVYICDEGGKYHYSRECYTLKRNYTAVRLEKVKDDHRPCSRCGGNHETAGISVHMYHGEHTYSAFCA